MFASFPVMAAWANAVVFASAGLVNLTALRGVREGYARWDIPGAFYRTLGIVEIIAAALLATPDLRAWGIAIAAPIMFGAIVMLLNHRQYLYAVPTVLVMAALVPVHEQVRSLTGHRIGDGARPALAPAGPSKH